MVLYSKDGCTSEKMGEVLPPRLFDSLGLDIQQQKAARQRKAKCLDARPKKKGERERVGESGSQLRVDQGAKWGIHEEVGTKNR